MLWGLSGSAHVIPVFYLVQVAQSPGNQLWVVDALHVEWLEQIWPLRFADNIVCNLSRGWNLALILICFVPLDNDAVIVHFEFHLVVFKHNWLLRFLLVLVNLISDWNDTFRLDDLFLLMRFFHNLFRRFRFHIFHDGFKVHLSLGQVVEVCVGRYLQTVWFYNTAKTQSGSKHRLLITCFGRTLSHQKTLQKNRLIQVYVLVRTALA